MILNKIKGFETTQKAQQISAFIKHRVEAGKNFLSQRIASAHKPAAPQTPGI